MKWKDHLFAGSASQLVTFDTPLINPVGIKFVVKSVVLSATEANYICGACAEMKFFSVDLQFGNIFTDKSYSAIKEGVTLDEILAMDDEFFRKIAEALYHKRYPMIRIFDYEAYPTPTEVNGAKALGLLDNATGIYVKKDEVIVVMVNNRNNQSVSVSLSDPQSEFRQTNYPLTDGISKFTMANDGLLYIKYHHPLPQYAQPITIHIASGYVNGYYDTQKHTEAEGMAYLAKAKGNYFDLYGKYVHLILPIDDLKKNAPSIKALVDKYDEILEHQLTVIGAIKYNKVQKNRICIKSGNRKALVTNAVIIPEYDTKSYTSVDLIKGDLLWSLSSQIAEVLLPASLRGWNPSAKDLYSAYVSQQMDGSAKLIEGTLYEDAFAAFQTTDDVLPNSILTTSR